MHGLPARRGEKSFASRRGSFLFASHLAFGWILFGGFPLPAGAITLPPPAPPLPPPSGVVVNVSTVTQLQNAVAALASNTTVLIAPGTYQLTQTLRISRMEDRRSRREANGLLFSPAPAAFR